MNSVEQVYQTLVSLMQAQLNEEWRKAWLNIKMTERTASANGQFVKPDGSIGYFYVQDSAFAAFEQLHQLTASDRWNTAKVLITRNVQLKVDRYWQ